MLHQTNRSSFDRPNKCGEEYTLRSSLIRRSYMFLGYVTTLLQLHRLCNIEWNEKVITIVKEVKIWKQAVVTYLKVLSTTTQSDWVKSRKPSSRYFRFSNVA
jgi:hypothetical protein